MRALDDVDLTVLPGEVHGLLGENGSGKSTLIKVLSGFHEPDSGHLEVRGVPVLLPIRPGQQKELGFEFVHQDLGLLSELSVTENLFLGEIATSRSWFYSWREARERAAETFRRYDVDIDPDAAVEAIRPVERALLAIIRALESLQQSGGDDWAHLLVLDEPTVFLPQQEVHVLFDFIRGIASKGSSVLFVSHDLDEVREITDRVSVLRDGQCVGTRVTAETSMRELVRLIIGHDLSEKANGPSTASASGRNDQPVLLRVRGLSTTTTHGVSFDLHRGEILGFAGLVGSGCEDIVYSLYGSDDRATGQVSLSGITFELRDHTPHAAMQYGMALVPADRQRDGSIATLSAADNINMPVLDGFFSRWRLNHKRLRENALRLMESFDVRPPRPDLDYGSFSGGNQQKAMMAKWQQTKPQVLLLHEPTQGVDVGARGQILDMIRANRDVSATICVSSDYEQLAAVCDRVGIIVRGRLVTFLAGNELTKSRIADLCMGGSDADTVNNER